VLVAESLAPTARRPAGPVLRRAAGHGSRTSSSGDISGLWRRPCRAPGPSSTRSVLPRLIHKSDGVFLSVTGIAGESLEGLLLRSPTSPRHVCYSNVFQAALIEARQDRASVPTSTSLCSRS